ncbi:outer membrane lipoprotein chaperone LolA [Vibrio hibernica]|uniref:outer membrane lipoprotein chaperone LolA n=1 Tax=Vibrio hibernica TaxID=2587465 RepID=UPI001880C3F7|nr:outer membrane lipoprotein chaperone LolA [Vibrio hibernica]
MKKWLSVFLFSTVISLLSPGAFANGKDELSSRLSLNKGFSADFSQKVTSPEGEVLMEGEGNAQISRPSLFRWETKTPDETILVSDGKSVWYYSPFVSQVTILSQEQATAQTPFVLLTRNKASDWAQYDVTQNKDTFTLKPTASDTTVGTFQIQIDSKGVVKAFNVIEQDGQTSEFVFQNVKLKIPSKSRFTFQVPKGVEVDDQR